MLLRKRALPSIEEILKEVERENLKLIAAMPGTKPCSSDGCRHGNGIDCAYVDRRGKKCQSAWCPAHRGIFQSQIYCPLHTNTMKGIKNEYVEAVHPDVDDRLPALLSSVARTIEAELIATIGKVADDRGEVVVSDPVQLSYKTVNRIRTWERSWKSCSPSGPGCRVTLGIEEQTPDEFFVAVNGCVVARVATPWELLDSGGTAKTTANLFGDIVMPISFALEKWQQGIDLTDDKPFIPCDAADALDFIADMVFEDELEMPEPVELAGEETPIEVMAKAVTETCLDEPSEDWVVALSAASAPPAVAASSRRARKARVPHRHVPVSRKR